MMKYVTIKPDGPDVMKAIVGDKTLARSYKHIMKFDDMLLIGIMDDSKYTMFVLKYGDYIIDLNTLFKDFTPIPGVDYTPTKKPLK